MAIYMNYDDLAIKGDVTESGHVDWIECSSFQLGFGRGISSPTGSASTREASAPSISEAVVTKDEDVASIALMTAALQGQGVRVLIDFCRTSREPMEVYLSVQLEGTMISSFTTSSSGERPVESLSLNFTSFTFKGTQMAEDGSGATTASIGYDLASARVT